MSKSCLLSAVAALAVFAAPASAAVVDPAGDFLPTYSGPAGGDLDILGASVLYGGGAFHLSATLNGAVGTSANTLYVWGINRGAGAPRLTFGSPSVGAGVLFDAVAVMFPDGLARAVTFPAAGPPSIVPLPGLVHVSGSTISASFQASLFPSNGLAPEDYTFTLWSRSRVNPLLDGANTEIADFAPGLRAAVPEPATWSVMVLGFGTAGALLRRRVQRAPLRA